MNPRVVDVRREGELRGAREDATTTASASDVDDVGATSSGDGTDAEGTADGNVAWSAPGWPQALLYVVAFLVVEAQVLFVSLAANAAARHYVLPKETAHVRPFHLDYQAAHPLAVVPLVRERFLISGQLLSLPGPDSAPDDVGEPPYDAEIAAAQRLPPSALLIEDGSRFDVWLKLSLPLSDANRGLFQVQVDMLAANATVVFRERRPVLVRRPSWPMRVLRLAAMAPLFLCGLLCEDETVHLAMVQGYRQKASDRIAQLRVKLLARRGREPPEFFSGEAHVLIKLNFAQHLMYHYPISSFLVLTSATFVALNWAMAAAAGVVAIAVVWSGVGAAPSHAAGASRKPSADASTEDPSSDEGLGLRAPGVRMVGDGPNTPPSGGREGWGGTEGKRARGGRGGAASGDDGASDFRSSDSELLVEGPWTVSSPSDGGRGDEEGEGEGEGHSSGSEGSGADDTAVVKTSTRKHITDTRLRKS